MASDTGTPTHRVSWQHHLRHAWLHRGVLAVLLWPLSILYGALVRARCHAYRFGWLPSQRLPVPVVVVGNVVVGGAGKTPTVMAIVRHLQRQGHRPGVISAGHGRTHSGNAPQPVVEVLDNTPAALAGDEPLLMRQTTQVPVFVARQRAQAGLALLARHPDTTVLVCDDGLQHLALHADVSVAVFDERGVGNGWLLPAGLLREPWPARIGRPVDLVLQVLAEPAPPTPLACPPGVAVFGARKHLSAWAVSPHGERVALTELARPGQPPITALAGIAKPETFFAMLRDAQLPLEQCWALADHQNYGDFFNSKLLNTEKLRTIIFTEKDAVKLFPLLRALPASVDPPRAWAVALALSPDPAFLAALDERLSSRHGHQTA